MEKQNHAVQAATSSDPTALARGHVATATSQATPAASPAAGALILHPEVHQAERNGKRVKLRKKEFQLLEFLSKNKNKILNRNTLLEYVWNYNVQSKTNTLEVHISTLRQKIDDYPAKILQTVHGLGYKFCDGLDTPTIGSCKESVGEEIK